MSPAWNQFLKHWLASSTLRNYCTCEWKLVKGPGAFADFDLWVLANPPFVSQFQLASARKSFKKLAPGSSFDAFVTPRYVTHLWGTSNKRQQWSLTNALRCSTNFSQGKAKGKIQPFVLWFPRVFCRPCVLFFALGVGKTWKVPSLDTFSTYSCYVHVDVVFGRYLLCPSMMGCSTTFFVNYCLSASLWFWTEEGWTLISAIGQGPPLLRPTAIVSHSAKIFKPQAINLETKLEWEMGLTFVENTCRVSMNRSYMNCYSRKHVFCLCGEGKPVVVTKRTMSSFLWLKGKRNCRIFTKACHKLCSGFWIFLLCLTDLNLLNHIDFLIKWRDKSRSLHYP